MRGIFSDGANSFTHFMIGYIGWPWLLAAGVGYQLLTPDDNTPVDLAEIAIGYAFTALKIVI